MASGILGTPSAQAASSRGLLEPTRSRDFGAVPLSAAFLLTSLALGNGTDHFGVIAAAAAAAVRL